MSRLRWVLIVVLVAELAVSGVLLFRQWSRPAAPVPDLTQVDSLAAAQLRELAQNCRSADDWAHLGEAYLAYGYFRESEACYRLAAEQAPAQAERLYEWAFALERLGRHAEANGEYERAIRLGYARPEDCWYFIGRNWLRQENAQEAQTDFQKAGDQPSARYEIAKLLVRASKTSEAIALLDRLSAEYPRAVQPYLLRHRIEVLQGSPLAGVHADRAAHASDVLPSPWHHESARLENAHDRIGVANEWRASKEQLAQGKDAEAEARLRSALGHRWDPAGVDLLTTILARRGQRAEALYLLQEVIDREGPSLHFLTRLGDLHAQAGRLDQARRAWSQAVHLGFPPKAKQRDYQHRNLAIYFEKQGDKGAAQQHAARAYYLAGHEAFWNEKIQDAQSTLEKAVAWDPSLAHAWFYLGETHRRLGQVEPARQAYQRCLKINPDHGRAMMSLALLDLSPR